MPELDVATLGEALGVVLPFGDATFAAAPLARLGVGGTELNVAVGLARLGHRVAWAGRLGDDAVGELVAGVLRREGVDPRAVSVDPEAPTGVYLRETGLGGRLRTLFHRRGSAGSRLELTADEVHALLDARLLHVTGVTALLHGPCALTLRAAVTAARDRGIPISVDVNARHHLLAGRTVADALGWLVAAADVVLLSRAEAHALFGTDDLDALRSHVREDGGQTLVVHDAAGAAAVTAAGAVVVPAREVAVVDTVGAGDAFAAGYLSGRLRGWDEEERLRFAVLCGAASVAAHGDLEGLPREREALAALGRTTAAAER